MKPNPFLIAVPLLLGFTITGHAAAIAGGNVTTVLGPNFFFDNASTGGTDAQVNQPNSAIFTRSFGTLNVGAGGSTITIGGIGWASLNSAGANDATSVSVAITYLGSDGAIGGGDDVMIGSVTDTFTFAGAASEYVWAFDTPMSAVIDGLNNQFRIVITPTNGTSNGSLSFKHTTGTALGANTKLSAAGTSVAIDPFPDTDADGIRDSYETNTGRYVSPSDTGTNPAASDTDVDGYMDGVETNTGTFISTGNTGTSPLDADYDNDGLLDGVEKNTGIFVSISDTGTSPLTRDRDGDRLSDKFEADNGFNPFANDDFDADTFTDALEVLFYGSDPKLVLSFPGDGTSPAPGSFTAIQHSGSTVATPGTFDLTGTLNTAIVNNAALGGSDFDYTSGVTDFFLSYSNAFPAAGSAVSITGFAWALPAPVNANGDILLQFFDPGADGVVDGIDKDTLVGTAKGTLTVNGVTNIAYWNFTPINFTSTGTGLMVKIQSTAAMRIKAQDNFGGGQWFRNDGRSRFGSIRGSAFSIGGTAVAPPLPKFLSIVRTDNSNNLVWDLNGVPTVTLQRSTTLSGFTDVPGKINTTDTSYFETSSDPKAFFRLTTP